MLRSREYPRIDFERRPELLGYIGSATIPEMIRYLPRNNDDVRYEAPIAKGHENRFVRGWYREGRGGLWRGDGLLIGAVASKYVVAFGIAPDTEGAQLLLQNTLVTEENLSIRTDDKVRAFSGCLARWQDIMDAPNRYHLYGVVHRGNEAYIMRPQYLVDA